MNHWPYFALLCVVGLLRLVELRISKHNQQALARRGAKKAPEPRFVWMVLFHAGMLAGPAAEVVLLQRPFVVGLAAAMLALFLAANGVRWWVIRTMREHWNAGVIASAGLGVVTGGPFHWVRHPNYAAVFVELIALPLIHTAWITAAAGAALHALVLRNRLRVEEPLLAASADYRALMADKPRFIPGLP